MATKQPVSINGIEFDAMLGEEYSLEASSPDYVVESGFTIGDSIILSAEILNLTLFVSDRPVTFKGRFGGAGRVDAVVKQLKELYYSKSRVSVTTPTGQYNNMAIQSLKISRTNEYGYAREVPITLKHIRTTASQTTSIPASYGKSGSTKAAAGTASTTAGGSGGSGGSTGSGGSSGSGGSGGGSSGGSNGGSSGGSNGSVLYNVASSIGLM